MTKWLGCVAIAALLAAPARAVAGELRLSIANGRVTIVAQDVTVRQILDEWQRVGKTTIVGADKLAGAPVTLELNDVAEGRALETLLRSASGYIAKPRGGTTGASAYASILIMPTSRPPAVSAAPPPAFSRPQPQVVMPNVIDEEGEPPPQIMPPGAVPAPPQQYPGQPMPVQGQPMPPGGQVPAQTLPRPGMLPPPAPGMPGSPYQTQPVVQPVRPPGVPGVPGPGGGGD